jgi:hypothetical protein
VLLALATRNEYTNDDRKPPFTHSMRARWNWWTQDWCCPKCCSVFRFFLLPFILDGLHDHNVHDQPTTASSLCDVPVMPESDKHAVAWNWLGLTVNAARLKAWPSYYMQLVNWNKHDAIAANYVHHDSSVRRLSPTGARSWKKRESCCGLHWRGVGEKTSCYC